MFVETEAIPGSQDVLFPFRSRDDMRRGRICFVQLRKEFVNLMLPWSVVEALRGVVIRTVVDDVHLCGSSQSARDHLVSHGSRFAFVHDVAVGLMKAGKMEIATALKVQHPEELEMIVLRAGQFDEVVPEEEAKS